MSAEHEDLIARAQASSQGFVVPEGWGEVVELEEGGSFVGRYRGAETDSRGNPIYLFWDEANEPRFFWSAYRLKQGMERETPTLGDTVCVFRDANYKTKFDDDEPTGIAYGVASEVSGEPLPQTPATADDDDVPF